MIKKIIKGILKDENLIKNIFTGVGYFFFTAGVSKIIALHAISGHWFVRIFVGFFFLILLALAFLFWLFYVVRPIVKITWPEFGLPFLDSKIEKLPCKKIFLRKDIIFFLIIAVLSAQGGFYIVNVLLENSSK